MVQCIAVCRNTHADKVHTQVSRLLAAVFCSVLQCVAACGSMLRCVAICILTSTTHRSHDSSRPHGAEAGKISQKSAIKSLYTMNLKKGRILRM